MKKIQILFPEPLMNRLRKTARLQDRPISDIIRRATEEWLDRSASDFDAAKSRNPLQFHGGRIKLPEGELRETAYQNRVNSE